MNTSTTIFERFIDCLARHKAVNIAILVIYYLLVVLPHEQVGLWTVELFKGYSRAESNMVNLAIALACLGLYGIVYTRNVWRSDDAKKQWFYMLSTIFLAALVLQTLFVNTIEVVHYVQYAFFAVLCFPLVKNYTLTLMWATLAGTLDEMYQYFYLAPHRTDYYDFNDVVTNLVGGAFGLLFLRSFPIKSIAIKGKAFLKSGAFIATVALFLITFILIGIGYLDVYFAEKSEATFSLVKKMPPGFWSHVHPNVTYHVMLPIEGTLVTIALLYFYSGLGKGASE